MSAFFDGFNIGFQQGIFNRMFPAFNPFGFINAFNNFNPFSMFNFDSSMFCNPYVPAPMMNFSIFSFPQVSMPVVSAATNAVANNNLVNNTVSATNLFETPIVDNSVNPFVAPKNQISLNAFGFDFNDSSVDTFTPTVKKSSSTTSNVAKSNVNNHSKKAFKARSYREMSDSEMKSVYGNYTKNVTELYKGTAQDLNKSLQNRGVLKGKGQAFINAQNKYGISASVLVAISLCETGGTSSNATFKYNIGNIRAKWGWKKYSSVEEGIMDMARLLKQRYVDEDLTCLYQINAKYCPVQDPTDKKGTNKYWAKTVNQLVNDIEKV